MSRHGLAAALIGVVVAACGLAAAPDAGLPIEDLVLDPRPRLGTLAEVPAGPHVEVLAGSVLGDHLAVAVQRDAVGVCMAVWRGSEGATSCGGLPGEDGPLGTTFGILVPGGHPVEAGEAAGPFEIAGMVVSDVASVVVELEDGTEARAQLVRLDAAQIDAQAFIVYLPPGTPAGDLVARADDGTELGRLAYDAPP